MSEAASWRVSALSMTPVKGLGLHHPSELEVTERGVTGDRKLYLVDDVGELISCTEVGELMRYNARFDERSGDLEVRGPEGFAQTGSAAPGPPLITDFYGLREVTGHVLQEWGELFSDIAGRPLRLVLGDSGGYDVAGLTLLGASSTAALATQQGGNPVDSRRFRMNVEITGPAAHEEDTWDGRELELGAVRVRVGGPVKRCAATTRNPDSGIVDLQTLRMIGATKGRQETQAFGKGFYFGVYADVLTPGSIKIGDRVSLSD